MTVWELKSKLEEYINQGYGCLSVVYNTENGQTTPQEVGLSDDFSSNCGSMVIQLFDNWNHNLKKGNEND